MRPANQKSLFTRFTKSTSRITGKAITFSIAILLILVWAVTGPIFNFGNTWQLVINTTTTIITFLMVFLIQSTQNRDAEAMQIKLDELIRANKNTHNALLDLEELEEFELDLIRSRYRKLADNAREELRQGRSDLGIVFVDKEDLK